MKEATVQENSFGVILENIYEGIKTLVEGQQMLFDRQERLSGQLQSFEEHTTYRLTSLELGVGELKEGLTRVEKRAANIENTMVRKEDFKPLERRVSKLEKVSLA